MVSDARDSSPAVTFIIRVCHGSSSYVGGEGSSTWVKGVHAYLCLVEDCDDKKSLHLQKQMANGWIEQPTSPSPNFKSGTNDALYNQAKSAL